MNTQDRKTRRRVNWAHILTVASAAILIGAEVFCGALAFGWALSSLFGIEYSFGPYGVYAVQFLLCAAGVFVMAAFFRTALRAEELIMRDGDVVGLDEKRDVPEGEA